MTSVCQSTVGWLWRFKSLRPAGRLTFSYDNCGSSPGRSLPMPQKQSYRRSSLCRLDYCNSLLFGIADDQLLRLQAVQNATARLQWCQELVVRTTLHQSCDSYIFSRSSSAWNTNWPLWRTKQSMDLTVVPGWWLSASYRYRTSPA